MWSRISDNLTRKQENKKTLAEEWDNYNKMGVEFTKGIFNE